MPIGQQFRVNSNLQEESQSDQKPRFVWSLPECLTGTKIPHSGRKIAWFKGLQSLTDVSKWRVNAEGNEICCECRDFLYEICIKKRKGNSSCCGVMADSLCALIRPGRLRLVCSQIWAIWLRARSTFAGVSNLIKSALIKPTTHRCLPV